MTINEHAVMSCAARVRTDFEHLLTIVQALERTIAEMVDAVVGGMRWLLAERERLLKEK